MFKKPAIPMFNLVLLAAIHLPGECRAADTTSKQSADKSYVMQVTELSFYDKGGMPFANGFGNPAAAGLHSNYIRLPGKTVSPVHTHTSDYYGVVITGVVANEPASRTGDRPLPPGSYWFQQGGQPHVTKCISPTECLFFVTQMGPFDFHPIP